MQLMVYARYGRAGIYMMQEYCRLLGIGTSESDLRELGLTLDALPLDHPISILLNRVKDFRKPEAMADALLHPQDRAFTVPELYAWLARCEMSFGRWYEQAPYLPQCGAIARAPHAKRLLGLPEPEQHAAVELFRGTIAQHNFVAYGDDGSKEIRAISFAGEHWRNYIPIRLPWAVCIRDRVPPGSAAVLLNPTHRHSDLVLPINAAQFHLFDQIDGRRTLDTILQSCGKTDDAVRALNFFEELWRYDLIAFDSSRALAAA
jgi:hypothetical protein